MAAFFFAGVGAAKADKYAGIATQLSWFIIPNTADMEYQQRAARSKY